MEWSEDFEEAEPGHRHISHLYGCILPRKSVNPPPEYIEAARKTIERRLAHVSGHTGWSRARIINFFARLADGNAAYENIIALLKKAPRPICSTIIRRSRLTEISAELPASRKCFSRATTV